MREGVNIGGDAAGGGVNVPAGARISTNDFYQSGNGFESTKPAGEMPVLQRASISTPRVFAAGSVYPSSKRVEHIVKEYPVKPAISTGSWPIGVKLSLTVEAGAWVIGEGGNGSAHAFAYADRPIIECIPGGDGGHAIEVLNKVSVTNGGEIYGGGGGGGGRARVYKPEFGGSGDLVLWSGGGGAGYLLSSVKLFVSTVSQETSFLLRQPEVGSKTDGGLGAYSRDEGRNNNPTDVIGGKGGGKALAGESGQYISGFSDSASFISGYGGLPGKAIYKGANLIEWINKGDVRGEESN